MREELNEEEVAAITVAFGKLDTDGDGVITRAELCDAMVAAGMAPSAEAIERELRQADLNADGEISLREWLHMWTLAILQRG
jgi:Ca2+-binding EF-hand superfamily protein